jgi:hypothetical protein
MTNYETVFEVLRPAGIKIALPDFRGGFYEKMSPAQFSAMHAAIAARGGRPLTRCDSNATGTRLAVATFT